MLSLKQEVILKRAADVAELFYRNPPQLTALPGPRSPATVLNNATTAAMAAGFNAAYAASAGKLFKFDSIKSIVTIQVAKLCFVLNNQSIIDLKITAFRQTEATDPTLPPHIVTIVQILMKTDLEQHLMVVMVAQQQI